jgi:hypothetical protein
MLQDNEIQQEVPQEAPAPVEPAPRPAKVKKPRKKRAPNKPKVKPVEPPVEEEGHSHSDEPVNIPEDHPAMQTVPDPAIDAVAAARLVIAAADAKAKVENTQPQNVQIRQVGMKLADLQKRLDESRNRPPVVVVPQAPTARQQDTINAEVAAGQRRVAHFAAQERARVPLPPDPKEPINTPVYRPADFVPDINSRDPAIGSQDLK